MISWKSSGCASRNDGAVAFVATRPDDYRIERTAVIAAPAEVVHGKLNDFHAWPEWSPWEKRDPNMTRTFDGPEAGVGSVYAWAGNDEVGEGRMTIRESVPRERVGIQLDFIKPFASTRSLPPWPERRREAVCASLP